MNDTTASLPEIRTVARQLLVRSWDYPVGRIEFLEPSTSAELRRAFATSLAMGSEGEPALVQVGVKDPRATQFVNVSFRVDSCTVQESAGHTLEVVSGPVIGGSENRTELLFVDGEIRLVTLVATDGLTIDTGHRS